MPVGTPSDIKHTCTGGDMVIAGKPIVFESGTEHMSSEDYAMVPERQAQEKEYEEDFEEEDYRPLVIDTRQTSCDEQISSAKISHQKPDTPRHATSSSEHTMQQEHSSEKHQHQPKSPETPVPILIAPIGESSELQRARHPAHMSYMPPDKPPDPRVSGVEHLASLAIPAPVMSHPLFFPPKSEALSAIYDGMGLSQRSGDLLGMHSSGSTSSSPAVTPAAKVKGSQPNKARRKNDRILPLSDGATGDKYVCPVCQKVLTSDHDLTKHIRSHNATTAVAANTCTICGKQLSSQSSLDRHMLVHSGERPFRCKVCKMSFTTNGNMHRHMRIHEKEGDTAAMSAAMAAGKSEEKLAKSRLPPRKNGFMLAEAPMLSQHAAMTPIFPTPTSLPMSTLPSFMCHPGQPFSMGMVPPAFSMVLPGQSKRRLHFPEPDDAIAMRESYALPLLPSPPKMPRLEPPQLTAAESEPVTAITRPETMLTPPQLSPKVMMPKKTPPLKVSASEESDAYVCPVCSKSFICKYGLETHMETHPAYALHCPSCHATFRSPRELEVHMFMVHTQAPSVASSCSEDDARQDDSESTAAVGFHELDFMDFSVEKFPLVARAWCEDHLCRPTNDIHHYVCNECNRGFPLRSSLNMHRSQHTPQYATTCNTCHARFTNAMALRKHELDHVASNVVVSFTEKSVDPSVKVQELVSKEEFLAVIGLQVKRPSVTKDVVTPAVREEMRINNDYFVKIGQACPFRPTKGYLDENCNDFGVGGSMSAKSSPMTEIARMMPHAASLIAHQRAFVSMTNEIQQANAALRRGEKLTFPHLLPTPGDAVRPGPSEDLSMTRPGSEGDHKPSLAHSAMVIPKLEALTPAGVAECFPCKYCAQTFSNVKDQKSHERSHQGLTPYQCTLCPYSSADKSTLIRHLRTHNGERPYQCALCEFAFTTKANCERHVRKKHGRETRAAIENAMICLPSSNETFSPPNTICRYCKVDFKFYRALKQHHLVSTMCRPRPYHCRVCDQEFVGQEESLLHVRQEHPEIEPHRVENAILVVPGLLEVTQRSHTASPASMPAHSNGNTHSGLTPARTEPNTEQPLDFSLKSSSKEMPSQPCPESLHSSPTPQPQVPSPPQDEDQPMDLSLNKRSDRQMEAATALHQLGTSTPAPLNRCEPAGSSGQLQGHMRSRSHSPLSGPQSPSGSTLHISPESGYGSSILPSPSMSSPDLSQRRHPESSPASTMPRTMEQVFRCHLCTSGFMSKLSLDHHLKTTHQQKIHDAFPASLPALLVGEEGTPGLLTIKRYLPVSMVTPKPTDNTNRQAAQTGYASDSSSDLASVTRILDAANSGKFAPFLLSSPSTLKSAMNPDELAAATSPTMVVCSEEIKRKMAQKIYGDKTEPDEPPMTPPRTSASPGVNESSHSPDDGFKQKKKRNSYADSPHKLSCPYCPRAFPWVSSLNRHILTHTGQKPFKCPKCPVMFSTKSNRERHLVRKHGLNVLDPTTRQMMDRPFKCHLCIFSSFSTAGNLYKHYQEKHPATEMPLHLSQMSPSALEATEGPDGYENTDGLSETSETRRHQSEMDDDEDEEPLIQDGLGQKLLDHSSVTQAIPENALPPMAVTPPRMAQATPPPRQDTPLSSPPDTPERQMNPERDNYNVDKITDCWKCGQSFPARKFLLKHLKEHNIDLAFKCYLCDASFDSRYESLEHLIATHHHDWHMLREKNQVENIEEFAKTLDVYVEYHFLGNRQLDVSSVDLSRLAGEDTRPEPDYLQRKVFCSLCPKRFWSLQDMRRHMRSHTGERPFECDICQKRFTLKHSMMRHRRKHLGQPEAETFSGSDEDTSVSEEPVPGRPVRTTYEAEMKPATWEMPGPSVSKMVPQSAATRENGSALLHNLLGVEENDIDKLFDSADSAARLLGVQN